MSERIVILGSAIADKLGAFGSVIAAMGCAFCFPALGSLAATIGLGFLAQFEGVFINTLLPIFAVIALIANMTSSFIHRRIVRSIFGLIGPIFVLATLYLFWSEPWSTTMLYVGLTTMIAVSILDLRFRNSSKPA